MKIKVFLSAVLITGFFAITGCAKEEGPMEKAGKSIDKAAQSAEDSAKEAADEVKKAVDG